MEPRTAAILAVISVGWMGHPIAGADDVLKRAGQLGARLGAMTDEARKAQKLDEGGVLILDVIPGTAAEGAGFKAGDVIATLDGVKVAGVPEFLAAISRRKGGDKASLGLVRDGRPEIKEVPFKPRPLESGTETYEVIYDSVASRGGRLRTIATRPRRPGKFPAFYLIQGLGGFSFENSPDGPYRRFIEDFARRDYVTFRVEKAGQGDSEGGPTRDLDFRTELDGYRQGLKALAACDFVDPENILVFGHSMGGVVAPLIAADAPIRGIAVYGTIAKTWYEYFGENYRRQETLGGVSASQVDVNLRQDAVIFAAVFAGRQSPEEVAAARPELKPRLEDLFAQGKYLGGQHYTFFRQLAETNVAAAWEGYGGHALAIWGRSEYISTEADHALIASIVNKAHPGRGTFVAIDSTDHGFRLASNAEDAYRNANAGKPGEINPVVLTTLREWADKITGRVQPGR